MSGVVIFTAPFLFSGKGWMLALSFSNPRLFSDWFWKGGESLRRKSGRKVRTPQGAMLRNSSLFD